MKHKTLDRELLELKFPNAANDQDNSSNPREAETTARIHESPVSIVTLKTLKSFPM